MKSSRLVLAALIVIGTWEATANAGLIINGPTFPSNPYLGVSSTTWGLQLHANRDAVLTGFDYIHRPFIPVTGQFQVIDLTNSGVTVFSQAYNANAASPIVVGGLSVTLQSGHDYRLVAYSAQQYGGADSAFVVPVDFTNPAYSNADIKVTSSYLLGVDDAWSKSHYWYSFTKITTESGGVGINAIPAPEPATSVVWSVLGLVGAVCLRRRSLVA